MLFSQCSRRYLSVCHPIWLPAAACGQLSKHDSNERRKNNYKCRSSSCLRSCLIVLSDSFFFFCLFGFKAPQTSVVCFLSTIGIAKLEFLLPAGGVVGTLLKRAHLTHLQLPSGLSAICTPTEFIDCIWFSGSYLVGLWGTRVSSCRRSASCPNFTGATAVPTALGLGVARATHWHRQ